MLNYEKCTTTTAVGLVLSSLALNGSVVAAGSPLEDLRTAAPRMQVLSIPGQYAARLYGGALSKGADMYQSADNFLNHHADVFGLRPENLVLREDVDGVDIQPVMLNQATGEYKFYALYYQQYHEGLPVWGGELTLLIRNAEDFPLVETISNLKSVAGEFGVPAAGDLTPTTVGAGSGLQPDPDSQIETVIYLAPTVNEGDVATVAYTYVVTTGEQGDDIAVGFFGEDRDGKYDRRRVFVDAKSGALLGSKSLIHALDVEGNVSAWATPGVLPDVSYNPPSVQSLPRVYADILGGNRGETDQVGDFVIDHGGTTDVTVRSRMHGPSLSAGVADNGGPELQIDQIVTPPGPADFLHNQSKTEFDTAEVNAMLHTSIIHNLVETINPNFPGVNRAFRATVNNNSNCNAYYDGGAINFFRAGSGCANMAFSTIIYHEYGHKIVDDGVANPGDDYHEGFGDTIAVVITDDPISGRDVFGQGRHGRTADNNRQYPCNGQPHGCGQVLSGCLWHTREAMILTEPDDYLQILQDLTVNSVLLHSGRIDPGITIDFLTLDDDDNDITNGTPHYAEIDEGFGRHNMGAPPIRYLEFDYPDGQPASIAPEGGTTMRVVVTDLVGQPKEGSARLHVNNGNGWTDHAMTHLGSNTYDAVFPAAACASIVSFYVTAETVDGDQTQDPLAAPDAGYTVVAASNIVEVLVDDFETDRGWTVENEDLTGGAWERGVPVGDGQRGDPLEDFDGSGSCYLTENAAGPSDVDGGPTHLISPAMDLMTAEAFVSFSYWFTNDDNDHDRLTVYVSNTGGDTWTEVEKFGNQTGWVSSSFKISDYVVRSRDMKVRFSVADKPNNSVTESAIDSIRVIMAGCGDQGDLFLATTPLIAGDSVRFTATAATPQAPVFFAYSLKGLGDTPVPQLNVTLGIRNPKLAGSAKASNSGMAIVIVPVPNNASGINVWLQAAENGRLSEILHRVVQ